MSKRHNITVSGKVEAERYTFTDEEGMTWHTTVIEEHFETMGMTAIQPWSLLIPDALVDDPVVIELRGQRIDVIKSTLHTMFVYELGIIPVLMVEAYALKFDPS